MVTENNNDDNNNNNNNKKPLSILRQNEKIPPALCFEKD